MPRPSSGSSGRRYSNTTRANEQKNKKETKSKGQTGRRSWGYSKPKPTRISNLINRGAEWSPGTPTDRMTFSVAFGPRIRLEFL